MDSSSLGANDNKVLLVEVGAPFFGLVLGWWVGESGEGVSKLLRSSS